METLEVYQLNKILELEKGCSWISQRNRSLHRFSDFLFSKRALYTIFDIESQEIFICFKYQKCLILKLPNTSIISRKRSKIFFSYHTAHLIISDLPKNFLESYKIRFFFFNKSQLGGKLHIYIN